MGLHRTRSIEVVSAAAFLFATVVVAGMPCTIAAQECEESCHAAERSRAAMDGAQPLARRARRPCPRADDTGREAAAGARHRLGRVARGRSGSAGGQRRRGFCARHQAPGHSRPQPGGFGRRHSHVRAARALLHAAAVDPRRCGKLGHRRRISLRLGDRPRAARAGLQHVDRRRRKPYPRAAQRRATSSTPAKTLSSPAA